MAKRAFHLPGKPAGPPRHSAQTYSHGTFGQASAQHLADAQRGDGFALLASAHAARLARIDPLREPPDMRLIDRLGPATCLRYGLLPWRRVGGVTMVLATHPGTFRHHRAMLQDLFGPVRSAYCADDMLRRTIMMTCGPALAQAAETSVPAADSCRSGDYRRSAVILAAIAAILVTLSIAFPVAMFAFLCGWAALTLVLLSLLKAAAAILALRDIAPDDDPAAPMQTGSTGPVQLPVVSLLVPLYREREIAAHLLTRLAALDYPRDRLDLCLVLEDDDDMTRAALAEAQMVAGAIPHWIQVIEVPAGTLRTKPRALNFALGFARGSIIGVYDAEDAPAPDQLRKVVAHFARRGPNVACLQGALDYYNSDSNWLSRCFTIEYATWFRIVLPGLLRMGLVIPLGGTTLFLRRSAIEALGGWDAHNVTEDADLGIRLVRHGYRTELIETVTAEEANSRLWPWIKQRSRWLKGYALTWAVHMRSPRKLWRDLGPWRFFGVQLLFFGTLSQFALAPLMWSFWPMAFGMPHPVAGAIPRNAFLGMALVLLASEVVNVAIHVVAARRAGKPWLGKWALTLPLYFPLATFAAYKGFAEIILCPYYWDKTAHGVFDPSPEPAPDAGQNASSGTFQGVAEARPAVMTSPGDRAVPIKAADPIPPPRPWMHQA